MDIEVAEGFAFCNFLFLYLLYTYSKSIIYSECLTSHYTQSLVQ